MTNAASYPLQWPDNIPRSTTREGGKFKTTLAGALTNVKNSIALFGKDSGVEISNIVLSSNYSLGVSNPKDPGVAAWFVWGKDSVCIPVDRYSTIEANLQAIHHIIEARRVELRHGTLALVRATMKGFKALPPPPGQKVRRAWTEVLGLPAAATKDQIEVRFRELSKKHHPDAGGSKDAFTELTTAREEALANG
jgi:hypothetical protein